MQTYLVNLVENDLQTNQGWYPYTLNEENYLIRYYVVDNCIVMALIDLSKVWSNCQPVLGEEYALVVESSAFSFVYDGNILEAEKYTESANASLDVEDIKLSLTIYNISDHVYGELSMPRIIIASCLLSLLAVISLVLYLNWKVNRPINRLKRTVKHISEGNFACRVQLKCRNRELQELAEIFNSMIDMIMQLKIDTNFLRRM